jgi:hypothetical protein
MTVKESQLHQNMTLDLAPSHRNVIQLRVTCFKITFFSLSVFNEVILYSSTSFYRNK